MHYTKIRNVFKKDFKFGNVSPIVDRHALETDEFLRDAFIIDTIINNQRLSAFNVGNENSIIYTKRLPQEYERRRKKHIDREPAIYGTFMSFVKSENVNIEPLKCFITQYFERLKSRMIC